MDAAAADQRSRGRPQAREMSRPGTWWVAPSLCGVVLVPLLPIILLAPYNRHASVIWDFADSPDTVTVMPWTSSNILGVAFDIAGRLHIREVARGGLLAAKEPENPDGFTDALIRVELDGTCTESMSEGLVAPTGLAIGPDDTLHVFNVGVMPGTGQILRITLIEE
jgi:hypothetical protein